MRLVGFAVNRVAQVTDGSDLRHKNSALPRGLGSALLSGGCQGVYQEAARPTSSMTKLVWRPESSTPLKLSVTVWPAKAETSNVFCA